jgi:hypothetical protein
MNQMAGDDMVNCTRHDGSNNVGFYWVDPTVHSPTEEISAVWRGWGGGWQGSVWRGRGVSGGAGEKNLILVIVSVSGHLKRVEGLTSNFIRGGDKDVFWNDPFSNVTNYFRVSSGITSRRWSLEPTI